MRNLIIYLSCSLLLGLNHAYAKLPSEQDVVNSALKFYPKIIEEQNKLISSKANYLTEQGRFDAEITTYRVEYEGGVYDNRYYNVIGVNKPLPFANSKIFTSYSKSSDTHYPLANDSLNTLSDGRANIGFSISLLRGFLTNEDVTKVKTANLDINIAAENLRLTKFTTVNQAKKAYYNYVTAQNFYDIALEIVNLRQERLNQVTIQSKSGDKPRIYIVDSRRSLLKSQSDLIAAKQKLQAAAFILSIFYRDEQGNKIILGDEKHKSVALLEENIHLPQNLDVEKEITRIKQDRADIKALNFKIEQEEQYLKLHKNQFLPELDFRVAASKDFGNDIKTPEMTDIKRDERINLGLNLSIPLQRNKQKGMLADTTAKISALKMEKLLIQDSIEIDIRSIYTEIANLNVIYHNLKQEVGLSQKLLDAEKVRFKNGDSDIITINIREQNLFVTKQKMLKSLRDILSLIADYNLLLMKE